MRTVKQIVKRLARDIAWRFGVRPTYGHYGVERQEHLGGYWRGGDPHSWCPELWQAVIDRFGIRSVIDVGCGEGYSTKFFAEHGLQVLGVEGGAEAISNSPVKHLIVHHDYTKGPYKPPMSYDLAWCCEFVEHVDERYVENFLATFAAAKYCLVTHAFPGQEGYHHVNCQLPEYWVARMAGIGFRHDPDVTEWLRTLTMAKHVNRSLLFFAS